MKEIHSDFKGFNSYVSEYPEETDEQQIKTGLNEYNHLEEKLHEERGSLESLRTLLCLKFQVNLKDDKVTSASWQAGALVLM